MRIKFWGVRGGVPTPEHDKLNHGGNTSCVSLISDGGTQLVLDAGSGFRALGNSMIETHSSPLEIHLLLSHYHWDHIQGIPFFAPLHNPANTVHFYGKSKADATIQSLLDCQQKEPYFPVPMQALEAKKIFHEVVPRSAFSVQDFRVLPHPVKHPGSCLGYRITCGKASIAYITDAEHTTRKPDKAIMELARGVDILIMDSNYTPEEYRNGKTGWGHGTWEDAVFHARQAEVGQLILFHHDHTHTDATLDQICLDVQKIFPNSIMAHEGLEIHLPESAS